MKNISAIKSLIISFLITFLFISTGSAVQYDGIEFPSGESSFADAVISYTPSASVKIPYNLPNNALGIPDYDGDAASGDTFVSLGDQGVLILKFTDNSLTTSGNTNEDLWIFEIGPSIEPTSVYISTDGNIWIYVGSTNGATSGIDIDACSDVILDTKYSYVKLVDDLPTQSKGSCEGADIDAVGAISSSSAPSIPEFPTVALPVISIIGLMFLFHRKMGK